MITVSINYFALLKNATNKTDETLSGGFVNTTELFEFIKEKYSFEFPLDMFRVALNDDFVEHGTTITTGDKIVFIPPVCGG
ncbi:MAG: MoaD/ThiS family protein [Fibrobacterales bacterium]